MKRDFRNPLPRILTWGRSYTFKHAIFIIITCICSQYNKDSGLWSNFVKAVLKRWQYDLKPPCICGDSPAGQFWWCKIPLVNATVLSATVDFCVAAILVLYFKMHSRDGPEAMESLDLKRTSLAKRNRDRSILGCKYVGRFDIHCNLYPWLTHANSGHINVLVRRRLSTTTS